MQLTKTKEKEILKVYNTWMIAYLNADVETYNHYFDDSYHFIGSTNNEELLNRKDTTEFFRNTGEQFSGLMDLRNERKILEQFGDFIFLTHFCDTWFKNEEDWSYYGRFRLSSILHPTKEGYKFIYQHFSMPDAKSEEGQTINFDKVHAENQELREAIKRRTIELEAKNRALEIQGALGRIRAQAVAMQQSTDLLDIVVTMRNEFIKLGHEAHYFWHMIWLPETYEKAMTSGDGSKIGFVMKLPRHMHGDIPLLAKWEKSKKPTVVYAMNTKEAIAYVDKMVALGDFQNIDPQAPTHNDIRHIGGLTFIMARTTHGEIGYSLPGVVKNPPAEDLDILVQFASTFDLAHRRFLDLQKAEEQAREAQIETALERVRSRSMAMHHSDEIGDVAFVLFQQLKSLGGEFWGTGFGFCEKNSTIDEFWFANENGIMPQLKVPNTKDAAHKEMYQGWKKGLESLSIAKDGKALKEHYKYMLSVPDIQPIFQGMLDNGISFPKWQKWHAAYFTYGYLLVITTEPYKNEAVFKRFAKVFQQAYTRFLDLQKAEEQAREAQIEAALERVRSQSMAMHTSDELKDVVRIIFEQMGQININAEHAGIVVDYEPKKDWHFWVAESQNIPAKITVPYSDLIWDKQFTDAKQNGKELFTTLLNFEEKNAFYKELLPHIEGLTQEMQEHYFKREGLAISTVIQKDISLYIENFSGTPYTEEENKVLIRFAKAFQQTYTRFLDLQKAEAQAREAQIENALEKVRSRTMAMQKSTELPEAANNLFLQVQKLGIPAWSAGYCIWQDDEKHNASCNMSSEGEIQKGFILPSIGEGYDFFTPQKNGEHFYVKELGGEPLVKHYEFMRTLPIVGEIFDDFAKKGIELPTFQIFHIVYFKFGYVMFITYEAVPDAHDIFKRFGNVFEQTYTRFLDLERAESQTREAQIEMALEKVRSRTMAMQHSDELTEAAQVLFSEVQALGIPSWSCGYNLLSDDNTTAQSWMSSRGTMQEPFTLEFKKEASFIEMYNFFESDETQLVQELGGKAIESHYDYMKTIPSLVATFDSFKKEGIPLPTYQINHLCKFNRGYLLFITYEKVPEAHDIFKRFTSVFEQTYTRFLDLKRAEAQAREAQIEAALERVRSQSMGMQSTNDFAQVTTEMFNQLRNLGEDLFATGIVFCDKHDGHVEQWHSIPNGGMLTPFIVPVDLDYIHQYRYDQWKKGEELFSIEIPSDFIEQHFEDIFKLPSAQVALEDLKSRNAPMPSAPAWEIDYGASFKNGYILASSLQPFENTDILPRFAKVFEQAYTRFLDLQTAEKNAYKSKVEAALERVRGRALAMQEPEELKEVANVLRTEMGILGIEELETSSIYILDEQNDRAECWYALKDASSKRTKLVSDHITMDFNKTWVGRKMLKFHNSKTLTTSIVMQGKNRKEWVKYCEEQSSEFKGYYGDDIPDRTYHLYKFSHGAIGAASAGDISEESWTLLKRSASVFSLAYSRFKDLSQARIDLQKLKTAKQHAEEALAELQTTQKQLIQSEKMASLGELTAGIAHEIQNPLNFVNNFSEVSKELLEEMVEELKNGDMEEVDAIANDVIQNLEKILHHGQRADGIVKGMLQHSRTNAGEKELTDINLLVDEYLRLAYHGLRAKDKSFNAKIVTNLDDTIEKLQLVPQDIGRVLLNLITNAFHACTEKQKTLPETEKKDFHPTVEVTTKKEKNCINISVKDNGNGVPEHIVDKIFQPFFTTKPTGQGTGLGLSLSYDIVQAHGGELKVETKPRYGTKFIIQLPK